MINGKVNIFLAVFISVLILSCDKRSVEPVNDDKSNFTLVAGQIIHDSLNYTELKPSVVVKGYRIGVDTNYFYNDSSSLDLNNDGIDDIQFKYYQEFVQPSCDCEGIDCCMPSGRLECWVKPLTNLEIASVDLMGLRPDRLSVGDIINNRVIWIYSNRYQLFSAPGMHATWYNDYYNSFMGFRLINDSDTLYGWLRMNTFHTTRIEIYDYVIEKE